MIIRQICRAGTKGIVFDSGIKVFLFYQFRAGVQALLRWTGKVGVTRGMGRKGNGRRIKAGRKISWLRPAIA
jgi:hypothetical protein